MGLRGSEITSVVVDDSTVLSGDALSGTIFQTVAPSEESIALRIDGVEVEAAEEGEIPVHRYTVSYESASGDWLPVCGVGSDGLPIKAIALEHLWDYGQGVPGGGSKIDAPGWITFACDGYALAKCVDLGYAPWRMAGDVSLAEHHQACTRMLRADYCGDGRSFAQDDIAVSVYDQVQIQSDTTVWITESEWNAAGARCVRRPRVAFIIPPPCSFELTSKSCGSPVHWSRTLIVSEAH
jgi:hypothetical protein